MPNNIQSKQFITQLLSQLIEKPSVSPNDCGCQEILINHLEKLGFVIERMPFGEVSNFWAVLETKNPGPTLVFSGHTDVVPTGNEADWTYPPFTPTVVGDLIYGRGTADMKGSIAAMMLAADTFTKSSHFKRGRLAFLITSDEEDKAIDGTQKVVEVLRSRNEQVDYCVVGEPSSRDMLGDVVKNGRRGSLTGNLKVNGVQGHVAYPHLAKNPVHLALAALDELTHEVWDDGNAFFPATSFQIANVNAGTGSPNVIPGEMLVQFNFRFGTELTVDLIKFRVTEILDKYKFDYDLDWWLSGLPFLTADGHLVEAVSNSVTEFIGLTPMLETTGGTSDGRFIATLGTQVVEIGPINEMIHKVDEHVSLNDLVTLNKIYNSIMKSILG
ncbi:succinyl-diaminopimelate desuccinylase [Thorsellia anophelis]|uniref:Succinyl-diaminopimelate desuccinylase n=1 Tax=Thorsellia anophelis DSM 18579 TaxID=1123402 RepID=A0A1I0CI34_9GAMM|nr:succinyl-diaminopimelate desuccinylase [Thorsellia anophelis]SET19291.1 succinyldiaminopimelate desuccinylase [Thorsellia anophelis DSM 18579]